MFDPTVRPAVTADTSALVELETEARSALADARGGERWLAGNPAVGDRWSDLVLRQDAKVFVADLDGVPVGLMVSVFGSDGTAMIRGTFVHPEARQCGFGDALMATTIAAARAHGCVRIEGEALPGDRETKNLYERAGITARLIVLSAPLDRLPVSDPSTAAPASR